MQLKIFLPLGLILAAVALLSVSGANGLATVNMASATTTPPILSDTTAPTARLFLTTKNIKPGQIVPIIAWADDNVGITNVEIYIDNTLKVSSSSTLQLFRWNTTGLAAGQHTLQVKAYDAAGNVGSSSIYKLKIKNSPPGQTVKNEKSDKGNHSDNENENDD
jgi:hypothetical protein